MSRFKQALMFAVIAIAGMAYFGLGITSPAFIPSYGVVMLDPETKTFIAPSCEDEWRARTSDKPRYLIRTTFGEAIARGEKMDEACRQVGAFHAEGRSVTGRLLETYGFLTPLKQWWDEPYRTEEGVVYPPATTPKM